MRLIDYLMTWIRGWTRVLTSVLCFQTRICGMEATFAGVSAGRVDLTESHRIRMGVKLKVMGVVDPPPCQMRVENDFLVLLVKENLRSQ